MTLMAYLIYFVNSKDLTPFLAMTPFLAIGFSAAGIAKRKHNSRITNKINNAGSVTNSKFMIIFFNFNMVLSFANNQERLRGYPDLWLFAFV
jgi:hypothetical protein